MGNGMDMMDSTDCKTKGNNEEKSDGRRRERRDSSRERRRRASTSRPRRRSSRADSGRSAEGDLNNSRSSVSSTNSRRESMKQEKSRKSMSNIISGEELVGLSTREQLKEKQSAKTNLKEKVAVGEVQNVDVVDEVATGTFDQLWQDGKETVVPLGGFFKGQPPKHSDPSDNRSVGSKRSQGTRSTMGGGSLAEDGDKRKTKLEKIHELQAKCDRYKQNWVDVTKEKKQCRKELQSNKLEVISLTKEIDTHVAETAILRKNLSQALQKLDEVQEEQRHERGDYSNAAKELAQARIDYAKSLNEQRELRTELDQLQDTIKDKDRKMVGMEDDLQIAKEKAEDMTFDLDHAEDGILRLEDEMKKLKEELIEYRTAADKDGTEGNAESLRKVREDMEQRLHDEREEQLKQKQQKLEEKICQFDEERERYHYKETERERELAERQQLESEKQKEREEEMQRMADEIDQKLKELEDDNTVLQGRLKSEQLNTAVKVKQKDERIVVLQEELSGVKQQLNERDADPNGVLSLQTQAEAAKAEAAAGREDLDEAQKHNGMLQDTIEELQTGNNELREEMETVQKEVTILKKDSVTWKRKAEEWQAKSGGWSDKAFLWKEKAELWEKAAKEADAQASGESTAAPAPADPQALFLQAAFAKKKATNASVVGNGWNVLGGLFNKGSEDEDDAQARVEDLEVENSKQAQIIKSLRSEMVKMQTMFKDQAYANQQKMHELLKDREAVELKNTNLMKELDLARKLERFASEDVI
jgi:hypothetical protein